MENINMVIGKNLNLLRKNKGYSLEKISEITGVSKGMLGQIERGETNPSISTLWKIAKGLHISWTSLLEPKSTKSVVVKKSDLTAVEGGDNYNVYVPFPYDPEKNFELVIVDLEPLSEHNSESHENGVEEYIYVCEGHLVVTFDNEEFNLGRGDSMRFLADKPHSYINRTNQFVQLHIALFYKIE